MANTEVEPMNPDEVKQYLKIYYDRVFPFDLMGEWLSYGENKDQPNTRFSRREFSFTTTMRDGSDVYSRYNSYKDVDDWRRDLVKTRANNPVLKIDIGAIYNVAPKQHQTTMVPDEKELVFDIDMTDYDDVRGCDCKQRRTAMCALCWPLMRVAAQVLEHVLREEFGYEHIMFVFSGRRGIHCWVLDARARTLTHEQRAAIGQYLSVTLKGGEGVPTRPELYSVLHPSLKWAYDHVLTPYFKHRVENGLLAREDIRNKILAYLPVDLADGLVADIGTGEVEASDSVAVWQLIVNSVARYKETFSLKSDPIRDIIFTFSYPRLDIEVTKQMNHLLKSPFVPHRDTGRICVPIADIKSFNPDTVPTLAQVVNQVTAGSASNVVRDYENTVLKPYLEHFKAIIRKANIVKATSDAKTDW